MRLSFRSLDGPRAPGRLPHAVCAVCCQNPRRLTAILYLNEAPWDKERDGGCLRAYLPGQGGAYMDVEPLAGRLLLFDALTVEHEVRESYRKRCAVTLWANGVDLT